MFFISKSLIIGQMAGDRHRSTGMNRLFGFKGYQTIKREILTQHTSAGNCGKLENKVGYFLQNLCFNPCSRKEKKVLLFEI